MMGKMRRWMEVPRGATAVEYLVILVVAVVFLLAVVELFAGGIEAQFTAVVDVIRKDMGKEPLAVPRDEEEDRVGPGHGTGYASSSGPGGAAGASSTRGGPGRSEQDSGGVVVGEKEETIGSVGGINPLVIIIAIGLILLLGYVVFGDKKN